MQKRLYEKIIQSRAVRSCLSNHGNGSKHLVCISVLKKLCNHPLLVYNSAKEFEDSKVNDGDFDEVFEDSCSLLLTKLCKIILSILFTFTLSPTVCQGFFEWQIYIDIPIYKTSMLSSGRMSVIKVVKHFWLYFIFFFLSSLPGFII